MQCNINFRTLTENQPAYLTDLIVWPICSTYLGLCFTNKKIFFVPLKSKTGSRAFSIAGPAFWKALPVYVLIRNAQTILTFRKLHKSHLFDLAFPP